MSSALSFNTNVVVVGEPVVIRVSGVGQREREGESLLTAVSHPKAEISVRREEGEMEERGEVYMVEFLPSEAVGYKLELKCKGSHVAGSPFSLWALDRATLTKDGRKGEGAEFSGAITGELLTFVVPRGLGDVGVGVWGPMGGECEVQDSLEGGVSFLPNEPGTYCITVSRSSGEEVYHLTAQDSQMGAMYCRVLEEDMPLFQTPIPYVAGKQVWFHVSTREALGVKLLQGTAHGPGEAAVSVASTGDGTECVLFSPACPGRYQLDMLWGGYHIPGSPFSLQFRRPKTQVANTNLRLEEEVFVMDTPHRFKLSWEGAREGDIQLSCNPPSAATLSVQPTTFPNTYLCQIVPVECGMKEVSVLFQNNHVPGSPFSLLFRPRGDASKCCVEGPLQQIQTGPSVKFFVSTAGAGEGQLTAVGRERGTGKRMTATVAAAGKERYMVEFIPQRSVECELGVMYDRHHIPGSPFKLFFISGATFSVEGDGLVHATQDVWSTFTVHTHNAGSEALSVSICGPGNRQLEADVLPQGPHVHDVHYLLSQTGQHIISVQWGKEHIPGSPFVIQCIQRNAVSQFTILKPSEKVMLGDPIEFIVENGRSQIEEDKEEANIEVLAKAHRRNVAIEGSVERDREGNFNCMLVPPRAGRYSVSVKCGREHLPGSPFKVLVLTPPQAQNVRVWGRGLVDHWLSSTGSRFTVDTTHAGNGNLGIKVSISIMPSFLLLSLSFSPPPSLSLSLSLSPSLSPSLSLSFSHTHLS